MPGEKVPEHLPAQVSGFKWNQRNKEGREDPQKFSKNLSPSNEGSQHFS